MSDTRRRYMAYLLRLWQVQEDQGPNWRASLERADTAERHWFANLEALFAFLKEKTDGSSRRMDPS